MAPCHPWLSRASKAKGLSRIHRPDVTASDVWSLGALSHGQPRHDALLARSAISVTTSEVADSMAVQFCVPTTRGIPVGERNPENKVSFKQEQRPVPDRRAEAAKKLGEQAVKNATKKK